MSCAHQWGHHGHQSPDCEHCDKEDAAQAERLREQRLIAAAPNTEHRMAALEREEKREVVKGVHVRREGEVIIDPKSGGVAARCKPCRRSRGPTAQRCSKADGEFVRGPL